MDTTIVAAHGFIEYTGGLNSNMDLGYHQNHTHGKFK